MYRPIQPIRTIRTIRTIHITVSSDSYALTIRINNTTLFSNDTILTTMVVLPNKNSSYIPLISPKKSNKYLQLRSTVCTNCKGRSKDKFSQPYLIITGPPKNHIRPSKFWSSFLGADERTSAFYTGKSYRPYNKAKFFTKLLIAPNFLNYLYWEKVIKPDFLTKRSGRSVVMDDQYGRTTLTGTPSIGIYSKHEYIAPHLYSIVGMNFEGDIKPAGFLDLKLS